TSVAGDLTRSYRSIFARLLNSARSLPARSIIAARRRAVREAKRRRTSIVTVVAVETPIFGWLLSPSRSTFHHRRGALVERAGRWRAPVPETVRRWSRSTNAAGARPPSPTHYRDEWLHRPSWRHG